MLGHYRHVSEAPFKWRFTSGQVMARFKVVHVFGSSLHSSKSQKEEKSQISTLTDKTFWIRACSVMSE